MNFLTPGGDLAPLARFCQIKTTGAGTLSDLQEDADAAAEALEDLCGPVLTVSATQYVPRPQTAIVARWRVATVTGFAALGNSTIPAAEFRVDGQTVTRDALTGYATWIPVGTLTFTSGFASAPSALVTAGRMRARQLWQARVGNQNQRVEGTPGVGVDWPKQALDLMRPYLLAPLGFA